MKFIKLHVQKKKSQKIFYIKKNRTFAPEFAEGIFREFRDNLSRSSSG